jgi:hypothetical protein
MLFCREIRVFREDLRFFFGGDFGGGAKNETSLQQTSTSAKVDTPYFGGGGLFLPGKIFMMAGKTEGI